MAKFKDVCHMCGGKGRDGGCPRCGLTPRSSVVTRSVKVDIPLDIIPLPYQGNLWTKPDPDGLELKQRDFDDKLDAVLNEFLAGRLPKFSLFMSAPAKYGKHGFAYSCMQTSIVQQFSVAPMFSSSDWRRLYRVSQMNPFYKMYDKYKWDDLVSRDVVFLHIDHSDDRFDVITLLKDILDVRAGFCKPTFIISDYKLSELTPHWQSDTYNLIYNPEQQRDFYRYPVLISRFL